MTTINHEQFQLRADEQQGVVTISGILRLNGLNEYAEIAGIMDKMLDSRDDVTLDLSELEFLNSSGIAMFSKFIINARKQKCKKLTIKGSTAQRWQTRSLQNLKRLMPALELVME